MHDNSRMKQTSFFLKQQNTLTINYYFLVFLYLATKEIKNHRIILINKKMKLLNFLHQYRGMVLAIIMPAILICSCSDQSKMDNSSQNNNNSFDSFLSQIDTILFKESDNSLYARYLFNSPFLNGNQYIVKGEIPGIPSQYNDYKSYVLFDNPDNNQSLMAFVVNKEYGIEKYAIFNYSFNNDTLRIEVRDLFNTELIDLTVVLSNDTAIFADMSDCRSSTMVRGGCGVMIFTASLPWTIGFGMVNPIAGGVVAIFFYILENWICDDGETLECPNCGSTKFIIENNCIVCKHCGLQSPPMSTPE